MFRASNLIFVFIFILSVTIFGLFKVKHSVFDIHKEINDLQKQISNEKLSMQVLKAEWEYLNATPRLKALAQKYLKLESVKIAQVKVIDYKTNTIVALKNNPSLKSVSYIPVQKQQWNFRTKDNLASNKNNLTKDFDRTRKAQISSLR